MNWTDYSTWYLDKFLESLHLLYFMYLSHLFLSLISKQNVLLNVHVWTFSRHILLYLPTRDKTVYKVVTTKRMRVNMPASQVQCRIQRLE